MCPTWEFCQICAPSYRKDDVVDLIEFSTYEKHGVEDDPIIFLRCNHFFTVSTLDGHVGINDAYELDREGEFIQPKSLLEFGEHAKKPVLCPKCKAPISEIFRYGRVLNLSVIRSMERKHMMHFDEILDQLKTKPPKSLKMATLYKTLKKVTEGPFFRVYEACEGSNQVEVPPPPSRPLIRVHHLMALASMARTKVRNDINYQSADKSFGVAISIAMHDLYLFLAATLKLEQVKFWISFGFDSSDPSSKNGAIDHLNWVANQVRFEDLVQEANMLKNKLDSLSALSAIELKHIVKVMSAVDGYNYGGMASSHWYQCPNGHPYFIGECGGAMEQSQCIECGAVVGGNNHRLLSTNAPAANMRQKIARMTYSLTSFILT
jgi:Fe2+ or Zn2+ uptake regulation protein